VFGINGTLSSAPHFVPLIPNTGFRQVPIDQVQKFLGHLHLSTTQIYAETSVRALAENYVQALT